MKKTAERKFRRLRAKSIWPTIVLFLAAIVVSLVLVYAMIGVLSGYVISNHLMEAHRIQKELVKEMDAQVEAGATYEEAIAKMSENICAPVGFMLVDADGNVLGTFGDTLSADTIVLDVEELDSSLELSALSNASADAVNQDLELGVDEIMQVAEVVTNAMSDYSSDGKAALASTPLVTYHCWVKDTGMSQGHTVYVRYEQNLYILDVLNCIAIGAVSFLIVLVVLNIFFFSSLANILSQRKLIRMMVTDPATGGANQLAFENFTERVLSRNKKMEYAVVDLSMTKYQNYCTMYGTQEGERLLTYMDQVICEQLAKGEKCAHVAGADFMLLLHNKSGQRDGAKYAERMNSLIENLPSLIDAAFKKGQPNLEGLHTLIFKAGIYVVDPVGDRASKESRRKKNINVDQLYVKAGIAKSGLGDEGGVMLYSHSMWEKEIWRQKVELMMEPAMENEEFQVYIQPKYNPSTNTLEGGEALVRWNSPTEGFISPGQFVPIFEENGFVTKLDDYMISHAAKLQAQWLAEGKKIVPISVNVSRLHFSQPDLAEHIRDLVDQYPLPHQYIEIELTESAFFDDKKALLSTVRRLQEYGFEVSMDDFGSGYSSLNSLKDLPLNVLKLDAEFFRGGDFDTRGKIVVTEAISLAKQLNMRIVAEGVEQKEHVDFLAEAHCDMIQGYYYAKPMPAEEYETRM